MPGQPYRGARALARITSECRPSIADHVSGPARVAAAQLLRNLLRFRVQVRLVDDAGVIDHEGLHPGHGILRRPFP